MNDALTIFGAGGHAKVVVALARARGIGVTACIDDDASHWSAHILGVEVRGPTSIVAPNTLAVIGIGRNTTRQRLALLPMRWATLVHPSAFVDPSAVLGLGTVVFAGAVVQPGARIGAHAIINTGATVDHDCTVGDCAHLAPGVHLAGDVQVGEGAFLGVGVSVIPGRSIGAWATIGAGAAVVKDVPPAITAVGVPARPIAKRS